MKKANKISQLNEPQTAYNAPLNAEEIWKLFRETDKKFQETDKQFKETDKKIKDLTYLFTSQWGKLVESLVEGDLIRLLNERGITVQRTLTNVEGN